MMKNAMDQKDESEVCRPNYHIMLDDHKEPNLTDLLELINALDEICTKYKVSWDYLQQLTQLVDDYFAEVWNSQPMILTADQISAENIRS